MTSKLDYDSIPAGKTEWDEDVNERFQEIKDKFNSLLEIVPIWPVLDFDGEDDYVDTGFTFDKDDFTYEAWVKVRSNASSGSEDIIDCFDGDSKEWARLSLSNGNYAFTIDNNGKKVEAIGDSATLDQWVHLAGVRSNGSDMTLYVNGEEQATETHSETDTIERKNPECIGSQSKGGDEHFNGLICEVRIWDVARTQQEIQDNMNSRLNGDESGLVAYYPLDEGKGNTVKDATGNGNDGTINGASWKLLNLGQHPVEGD